MGGGRRTRTTTPPVSPEGMARLRAQLANAMRITDHHHHLQQQQQGQGQGQERPPRGGPGTRGGSPRSSSSRRAPLGGAPSGRTTYRSYDDDRSDGRWGGADLVERVSSRLQRAEEALRARGEWEFPIPLEEGGERGGGGGLPRAVSAPHHPPHPSISSDHHPPVKTVEDNVMAPRSPGKRFAEATAHLIEDLGPSVSARPSVNPSVNPSVASSPARRSYEAFLLEALRNVGGKAGIAVMNQSYASPVRGGGGGGGGGRAMGATFDAQVAQVRACVSRLLGGRETRTLVVTQVVTYGDLFRSHRCPRLPWT